MFTIEEHVQTQLAGVTQTERKESTVVALETILHHDPDVVLLSRLDDPGTTDLALQTATGRHFVLAGVHTRNAAGAVHHLLQSGSTPFATAAVLRAALAEATVPQLCTHCRIRHELTQVERHTLEQQFGITSPAARARVHELERQAVAADLGQGLPINSTPSGITHVWQAKPGGCDACHHRGTAGQIALCEVLTNTERLRTMLTKQPTIDTLQHAAVHDGAILLGLDGLIKALRGLTTTEAAAHFA